MYLNAPAVDFWLPGSLILELSNLFAEKMIRNSNLLTEKLCRCVDVPGFRHICTSAQEANAAVEMLRHFLLGWGIEMDKPEIGGRLHEK